jgi:D-alanyl-D-alanine carboxypeptidase/D-alanyl-D-alanine-endopeptidase (penicillin-binding protein 4)
MSDKSSSTGPTMLLVLLFLILGLAGGYWLAGGWRESTAMKPDVAAIDSGARAFAQTFAEETQSPAFDGVAVSMVVLDEDGAVWFASPLAHTAMCPASALKVLTTGAALAKLGPDFRFTTTLASAAPAAPMLDGDLVIVGSGDPMLSSAQIEEMAGALVAAGVRRIDGRVLADATVFPEHPMSDHWNWGDIGNAYGAGAYGLNIDHNRMVLRFRPAAVEGDPVEFLGADAALPGVSWNHLVTTGPAGSGDRSVVYSEPYGTRVTTRGTLPAGAGEMTVRAAIPNPPETAAAVLFTELVRLGVEITGRVRPAAPAVHVLATAKSVPLIDIVRSIHHTSDNLETQCLFLAMAPGGDAVAVVKNHWAEQGIEFAALRMLDGSGLARANMIRAIDLAKVSHAALNAPHGREFFESLPAYQDETVRSKPGWMSGVTTSTGAITTVDGRRMTYAFMANGVPDPQAARDLRHRLREAVAMRR